MADYPCMFRLRQHLERPHVADVQRRVEEALDPLRLGVKIHAGQSVAITVGSRGIANVAVIVRAAAAHLKNLGARPFVVPAMGSHGGATAAGQRHVIEQYGVTESFCGCPIRSSMETVVVCHAREGFPVHFDRQAYEADHVLVCGRVKPHTRFTGDVESGLMKMLLVGLGKHAGASVYHRAIQDFSFGQIVRSVSGEVLSRCNIVGGVAIVENAYDETADIVGVVPSDFEVRERELLSLARRLMPKLPFDRADVLLVDEIGKDISGTGLDTNVVGRKYLDHVSRDDEFPKIKFIAVRGLSRNSSGNATGLGLVEFCRSGILQEMDVHATRTNCVTSGHPTAAMIPLHYQTDREILDAALSMIGLTPAPVASILWIQNTLSIAELECSEAYYEEACERPDLQVLTRPRALPLDGAGNLPLVSSLF